MLEVIPNWHPIFVHFSVAFISSLGILQLFIWIKGDGEKQTELLFMQKTLMIITVLSVVATVFTGWLAFNSVAHDTPSHMAMTDHRNWAITTALVFLVGAITYFVRPSLRASLVGVLMIASASLVAITGFKGGEVVYRYGLGVMSLPQVSETAKNGGDGHDHEHGGSSAVPKEDDGHGGHGNELVIEKKAAPKPHLNDGHAH
ncbi:MAG: DUF2231 domain-containing protein [Bermanella sp.]